MTISDVMSDHQFVHVVIGYGEQFYGPFTAEASLSLS